jgi:hypothetical protein
MPSITIRDLSEEAHAKLTERARKNGQSLQQYLRMHLEEIASHPTNREIMEKVRERVEREGTHLGAEEIVRTIHEGREERTERILSSLTRPSSSPR